MRIQFEEVKQELKRILLTRDCPEDKAEKVAHEMARNSLEGTYTHGINRFARVIRTIDDGDVDVHAEPEKIAGFGAIENYDARHGLGITTAWFAMERCIELAKTHGIGFIAMRNTNHWQRAATYGIQACDAGMAGMCFTNTIPNMPTWGAVDARLGNNPLVLAFPCEKGHVVVDMAMSQFSYGALELAKLEGRQTPIDAGFDAEGNLTRDPDAVMKSARILPTGYWKGAALSFVLDVFAGCMSLGNTEAGISRMGGKDNGTSQVFMAVNYREIAPAEQSNPILEDDIAFLLASKPGNDGTRIAYPGQKAGRVRAENLEKGIPVDERVWRLIGTL